MGILHCIIPCSNKWRLFLSNEKWLTQVKKGLLELCLLNILAKEQMHGYELVRRLTAIPGVVVTVGTIYPLLGRLKREGLLASVIEESASGPPKRIYELSSEGKKRRIEINETWNNINKHVEGLMIEE